MRFHPLRLSVIATLVALVPFVASAQECAELGGIEHCAVGGAALEPSGGNLITVQDTDRSMESGVDINFSEGLVWETGIAIKENLDENTSVTAVAYSQGKATATNTISRNDDGSLGISATFTGAAEGRTYNVQVYNNGVFQGGTGGIDDGVQRIIITNQSLDEIMWLISMWQFHFRMHDGGCGWGLELGEVSTLRLADGTVLEGDEIRLQEEVKGDGHYAYTGFDGIEIVGNPTSMTLSNASVLP